MQRATEDGATDLIARKLADALSDRWSTSVVVENRPGASGLIGYVARSKPDGYTLLLGMQTALAVTPTLAPASVTYDPIEDFSPITLLVTTPLVLLVSDKTQAASAPEFIRMLKQAPSRSTYGCSGVGTSQHLRQHRHRSARGQSGRDQGTCRHRRSPVAPGADTSDHC